MDILKVTIIAWKLLIESFVVFKKILAIDNFLSGIGPGGALGARCLSWRSSHSLPRAASLSKWPTNDDDDGGCGYGDDEDENEDDEDEGNHNAVVVRYAMSIVDMCNLQVVL